MALAGSVWEMRRNDECDGSSIRQHDDIVSRLPDTQHCQLKILKNVLIEHLSEFLKRHRNETI
jgi:hypothetical protein